MSLLLKQSIALYHEYQKSYWVQYRTMDKMKILKLQSNQIIGYRGHLIINQKFEDIVEFFENGGENDIQLQLQNTAKVLNIDQELKIHQSKSVILIGEQFHEIDERNIIYTLSESTEYIIFKQSQKITSENTNNTLQKIIDVVHISKNLKDLSLCSCEALIIFKSSSLSKIHKKLVKEQIINLSILNYEMKQMIQDKSQPEQKLPVFLEQNSINSFIAPETHNLNEENLVCDNIYLSPNDRQMFKEPDMTDPSFIYADMHDRKLPLTSEQLDVFYQFKEKMQSYKVTDNSLIRQLQARNFISKEAEELLINCIKWRKEFDVNSRKMSDYPAFQAQKLHQIIGEDKWGHPILYNECANSRPDQFQQSGDGDFTVENYLKFNQAFLEEAILSMRGNVDSYLVIIDCLDAGRKNIPPLVIKEQFKVFFQFYACRPYKNIIINANFLINSMFLLAKPLIPQRTLERLVFIGKNNEQIKAALLKEMDISQVPQRYGGGNTLIK